LKGQTLSIDPTDIRLDDLVQMRKPHPCGSTEWRVVRLGTDIGLICQTCGRKVLIPRGKFIKQVKTFLQRGPQVPPLPTEPPES
jgi:hypothetical protein